GRERGREAPERIARDRAHGVAMFAPSYDVGRHRVREVPVAAPVVDAGVVARVELAEALHARAVLGLGLLAGGHFVREATLVREARGTLAYQEEVRGAVHDRARHPDRVAHAL